jgi:serine/threonine protein kinase
MRSLKNGEYTIPNDVNAILGAGNFGKVYKAFTRDKQKVAIKEISKSKLEEHPYIQEAFESEIETQRKATNSGMPYFVKLLDNFSTEDYEYVVLEFCDGGTLTDYYKKNKLSVQEILEIIYQIGIGVEYLHRIGITHRDMKLDNVLKMGKHYKIADFGFATEKSVLETCLGTGYYMSPELVKEEEYDRRVDVWAVNTILYKMLTNKYYFDGRSRNQLDNNIKSQKFRIAGQYNMWPNELKDLLVRGYEKDFRKRPNMLQYIEHPAFKNCGADHKQNANIVSRIQFKAPSTLPSQGPGTFSQTQGNKDVYNQVERKLINYINNLKKYFDVYAKLRNHDLTLGLVCLKRYLQHISLINIFFHNKKYIITGAFKASGITQNHWREFYSFKEAKKFVIRVYHHLFVAIREYKNGWTKLEEHCLRTQSHNPLNFIVSQPIKFGMIEGLKKFDSAMASDTDPIMLQTRKLVQRIIILESSPSLIFQSS